MSYNFTISMLSDEPTRPRRSHGQGIVDLRKLVPQLSRRKKLLEPAQGEISFSYEEIDIDSDRGKELAERYHIRSVPTSLVNGRPYFVGVPEKQRAVSLLKSSR